MFLGKERTAAHDTSSLSLLNVLGYAVIVLKNI